MHSRGKDEKSEEDRASLTNIDVIRNALLAGPLRRGTAHLDLTQALLHVRPQRIHPRGELLHVRLRVLQEQARRRATQLGIRA